MARNKKTKRRREPMVISLDMPEENLPPRQPNPDPTRDYAEGMAESEGRERETATKKKRHELSGEDAIRLLCNAIQKVYYFEKSNQMEGMSPACRDPGEVMLQEALGYLAYGDTAAARELMDDYEEWLETGVAGWPYDGSDPPADDGLPF